MRSPIMLRMLAREAARTAENTEGAAAEGHAERAAAMTAEADAWPAAPGSDWVHQPDRSAPGDAPTRAPTPTFLPPDGEA